MDIRQIVSTAPVIPVITLRQAASAVPLARALVAGGLPVIEMTLRTPVALEAIRAIAAAVPDAIVGAGTVTEPAGFAAATAAGARFAVSPGFTPALSAAAKHTGLPFLPGVMTSSEIIAALGAGHELLKFFPAEPAGGIAALKALAGPFPQVTFCPTGGIHAELAKAYLALSNVIAVGGSWVTPQAAIDAGDWAEITRLAKAASALRSR
jgi:2-dehydro-3-deoxyphosphogluconate aldolase / (4S)-4-hydroxy-2-oxoglutarate aldolase